MQICSQLNDHPGMGDILQDAAPRSQIRGGQLAPARPSHAPQAHGVVTRVRGAELPDGDRDKVGGEVHGEPLLR